MASDEDVRRMAKLLQEALMGVAKDIECDCPRCYPGGRDDWTKVKLMEAGKIVADHLLGMSVIMDSLGDTTLGTEFNEMALRTTKVCGEVVGAKQEMLDKAESVCEARLEHHRESLAEIHEKQYDVDGNKIEREDGNDDEFHE